ncbi:MAG: succinyl-diaminopimelate desuccinylase [Acidiferrobacterales bacterium]
MNDPTLELASELIRRPSVTPNDEGCQQLMIDRLQAIGFEVDRLRFEDVDNFWARRGTSSPLVVFAGHTDVVPTGPLEQWDADPFDPTLKDGFLYGRGAADMKSSLAAFITSIESFVTAHPDHTGSIGLLITSDEEGPSINGTVKVVEWLQQNNIKIDYCIVGEPSSEKELGDVIKNGRRGSLNGRLRVSGKQGHVAYPHLARNPIHEAMPALIELSASRWDQGNDYFPATTLQISNIRSGTGAENVIPGELIADFNFRFCTEVTEDELKNRTETILKTHKLDFEIHWRLSGYPFLTPAGTLVAAVQKAIQTELGRETVLSTGGGTSDGRFIAPTGAEVVELGPLNNTIHQVNENVAQGHPAALSRVYHHVLVNLLAN